MKHSLCNLIDKLDAFLGSGVDTSDLEEYARQAWIIARNERFSEQDTTEIERTINSFTVRMYSVSMGNATLKIEWDTSASNPYIVTYAVYGSGDLRAIKCSQARLLDTIRTAINNSFP